MYFPARNEDYGNGDTSDIVLDFGGTISFTEACQTNTAPIPTPRKRPRTSAPSAFASLAPPTSLGGSRGSYTVFE